MTLTPITKTTFAPAFRSGRVECWGAVSNDGQWTYVREDSPGTPWLVYHTSHDLPVSFCGTLRSARLFTALPNVLEYVDRARQEAS